MRKQSFRAVVNETRSGDCVAHSGSFDHLFALHKELKVALDPFIIQAESISEVIPFYIDDLAKRCGELSWPLWNVIVIDMG